MATAQVKPEKLATSWPLLLYIWLCFGGAEQEMLSTLPTGLGNMPIQAGPASRGLLAKTGLKGRPKLRTCITQASKSLVTCLALAFYL